MHVIVFLRFNPESLCRDSRFLFAYLCVDRLQRVSKDGAMKCWCKSAFSVKRGENMKKTNI